MAGQNRTATDALTLLDEIRAAPHKFDFFQALRLLECAYPDKPRMGESTRPSEDPVRLGQDASMAFAPATFSELALGKNGRPPRLLQRALGLFGPNGPLPLYLTEYVHERRFRNDHTLGRFADIFHHRMLSLFYRAWAKAQPAVHFDRPESDRFAAYVGSLFGMGTPGLRGRDAMPDRLKLYFSGRLASEPRNAEGLEAILATYLRTAVVIEPFVGHWLKLPEGSRTRLGESPNTGTLGRSAMVGARVWDRQHKFRAVIGPLRLEDYLRLLPQGENYPGLAAIMRNYVGDELMWDATLILKKEDVPPIELGTQGQLGRTTWLAARSRKQDAKDLTLHSTVLEN